MSTLETTVLMTPNNTIEIVKWVSSRPTRQYIATDPHGICLFEIDTKAYHAIATLKEKRVLRVTIKSNSMFTRQFMDGATLIEQLQAGLSLGPRYLRAIDQSQLTR